MLVIGPVISTACQTDVQYFTCFHTSTWVLEGTCLAFFRFSVSFKDVISSLICCKYRCNTSSVESQLRSKRLRWLGHIFRIPNDRLPKKLLFGQVKGIGPSGRPRLSYNDVASSDCHECRISTPYKDAQNRLLWRNKTCPART